MSDLSIAAPRRFRDRLAQFRTTLAYDMLARTPLVLWVVLTGYVSARLLLAELGRAPEFGLAELTKALASLAGLGFIVLFTWALLLRRQPVARAAGVFPRLAAFAGTFSIIGIGLFPRAELSLAG